MTSIATDAAVEEDIRPGSTLLGETCRDCNQAIDTTRTGEFRCEVCGTWWPHDAEDGDIGCAVASSGRS